MRKSCLRIISEALRTGDGTLRLVFLMITGVTCTAMLVAVWAVARLTGLV